MLKIKPFIKRYKVTVIIVLLLIANVAFFQITASIFAGSKKAEVEERQKEELSYFDNGLYIFHLGHSIVDYFHRFGEKR